MLNTSTQLWRQHYRLLPALSARRLLQPASYSTKLNNPQATPPKDKKLKRTVKPKQEVASQVAAKAKPEAKSRSRSIANKNTKIQFANKLVANNSVIKSINLDNIDGLDHSNILLKSGKIRINKSVIPKDIKKRIVKLIRNNSIIETNIEKLNLTVTNKKTPKTSGAKVVKSSSTNISKKKRLTPTTINISSGPNIESIKNNDVGLNLGSSSNVSNPKPSVSSSNDTVISLNSTFTSCKQTTRSASTSPSNISTIIPAFTTITPTASHSHPRSAPTTPAPILASIISDPPSLIRTTRTIFTTPNVAGYTTPTTTQHTTTVANVHTTTTNMGHTARTATKHTTPPTTTQHTTPTANAHITPTVTEHTYTPTAFTPPTTTILTNPTSPATTNNPTTSTHTTHNTTSATSINTSVTPTNPTTTDNTSTSTAPTTPMNSDTTPPTSDPATTVTTDPTTTVTTETTSAPPGLWGHVVKRYTWYLDRLAQSLENEMPRTFRMFRIFSVGLKAFVIDFRDYVGVLVTLSFPSGTLEGLTRPQLELYKTMPADMLRVFPVLAVSAVPFGQNVALPLGYWFPRQLLCRHFWDLQQTHDFGLRDIRTRLLNARPVFRCLQARVEELQPLLQRVSCQSVWHQLGSGVHPTTSQVLALRPVFCARYQDVEEGEEDSPRQDMQQWNKEQKRERIQHPYSITNISRSHVKSLARLHGLRAWLGARQRLRDHARWLRCHDAAITASEDAITAYEDVQHSTGNIHEGSDMSSSRSFVYDTSRSGSFVDTSIENISAPSNVVETLNAATSLRNFTDVKSSPDASMEGTAKALAAMHINDLRRCLVIRCVTTTGLDNSGMVALLLRWLTVARHLQEEDMSLLLHLPILLNYNYSSNLALVANRLF